MARKLRSDEMEVFNSEMDLPVPTGLEALLPGPLDEPEELLEVTVVRGRWLDCSLRKPPGS